METLVKFENIEKNKWFWIQYGEPIICRVVEVFSKDNILVEYWPGVFGYDDGHSLTHGTSLSNFLRETEDPRPAPPEPFLKKAKRWVEEFKKIWE